MATQKGPIAESGWREFELRFNFGDCLVVLRSAQAFIGNTERIQVIERQAYEMVLAELNELKKKKAEKKEKSK